MRFSVRSASAVAPIPHASIEVIVMRCLKYYNGVFIESCAIKNRVLKKYPR